MGSPGWNFCVICLSDLEVKGPQGEGEGLPLGEVNKTGKSAKSVKFLISCLLTTRQRRHQAKSYEGVLKDFLKLSGLIIEGTGRDGGGVGSEVKTEEMSQEDKEDVRDDGRQVNLHDGDEENMDDEEVEDDTGKGGSDSEGLQICDKCEVAAGTILDLHRKLNKLRTRLSKEVESVKETILRSSGWLGGIRGGAEAFDNFSRKFCQGAESPNLRETFEILKAFQAAVNEADFDPIQESPPPVPVRARSTGDPHLILNGPSSFQGSSPGGSYPKQEKVTEDFVKTEPPSQDPLNEDESDSLRLDNFFDDFVTNYYTSSEFGAGPGQRLSMEVDPPPPTSERVKVRKSRTSSRTFPTPSTAKSKQLKRKKRKLIEKSPKRRKKKPQKVMEGTTLTNLLSSITPKPSKKAKRDAAMVAKMLASLPPPKLEEKSELPKVEKPDRSHLPPPFPPGPYIPPHIRKSVGGRYYPCDICGYKATGLPMLEQHLRGHETEVKAHRCDQCGQGFTTQQHYGLHADQHYGHHKLMCEICKAYMSTFHLPEHLKTHHEGATVYPCSLCPNYHASVETYVDHIRFAHVGGGTFSCAICGNAFERKLQLLQHLQEAHGVIEKYECGEEGCGKSFFGKDILERHRRNAHMGKFYCDKCCKYMSSLAGLQTHQRLLHTNSEKPFKCDQCPDSFNMKMSLKNHMVKMHGAEKFKCEICSKEYNSIEGYQLHKRMLHSEFVRFCPICNKKCPTDAKLRAHMEDHSTESNYMCEVCGKAFVSRDKCSKHKRRAHGEKKFKCTYCTKGFTDNEYLILHLRTHTGEKPFACDICGKAFSQRGSVIIHKRKCRVGPASSSIKTESESVPEPEPPQPEPGSSASASASASANLFPVPSLNLNPF